MLTILLSPEEILVLERRYNDDLGFDYFRFLQELEARPIEEPLYRQMLEDKIRINAEKPPSEPHEDETNIVLILAKIKAKVVRERIKVIYCLIYRIFFRLIKEEETLSKARKFIYWLNHI